jgi:hypothetical protein
LLHTVKVFGKNECMLHPQFEYNSIFLFRQLNASE